jgi:hypothetical protein
VQTLFPRSDQIKPSRTVDRYSTSPSGKLRTGLPEGRVGGETVACALPQRGDVKVGELCCDARRRAGSAELTRRKVDGFRPRPPQRASVAEG